MRPGVPANLIRKWYKSFCEGARVMKSLSAGFCVRLTGWLSAQMLLAQVYLPPILSLYCSGCVCAERNKGIKTEGAFT